MALQPQNQIPAARRLDKQNPQASTAPSRGGGQALPTVRLKVEFREQVTTTINSAAKGRREGEVGGAVSLKVSGGKTRNYLKMERKISTKLERG